MEVANVQAAYATRQAVAEQVTKEVWEQRSADAEAVETVSGFVALRGGEWGQTTLREKLRTASRSTSTRIREGCEA